MRLGRVQAQLKPSVAKGTKPLQGQQTVDPWLLPRQAGQAPTLSCKRNWARLCPGLPVLGKGGRPWGSFGRGSLDLTAPW